MAKINKMICLEKDVINQLKGEKNASKLINDLLNNYFGNYNISQKQQLQEQQIQAQNKLKKINKELKKIKDALRIIEKKEKELIDKFKDIPESILSDFRKFPNMTIGTLRMRYSNIYFKYSVTLKRLIKALEDYKNI